MKHKIEVTQIFRAERKVVIEVNDPDGIDSALEQVASGDFDLPAFDDPRWQTGWELQNENVVPAK